MAYNGEVRIKIVEPKIKEIRDVANGNSYFISSNILINDMKVLFECYEETKSYEKAVASIIYEHHSRHGKVKPIYPLEVIEQASETVFLEFVDFIVNNDKALLAFYNNIDNHLPVTQRFYIACGIQLKSHMEEIKYTMEKFRPTLEYGIRLFAESLSKTLEMLDFAPIFHNLSNAFFGFAKNMELSSYQKNEREKLIEAAKKWGQYGWTSPPNSQELIWDEPADIEEANQIALKCCCKSEVDFLISVLRDKGTDESDLEEAEFCYNNQRYKACALVLFGIIESMLIRKQITRGDEWRKVTIGAVKVIRGRYEVDTQGEDEFLASLVYLNLFECLEVFFEKANDFKIEPPTINRNFIAHGMSRKKVTKMDCIQLFLALYNLVFFLEIYASSIEKQV